MKIFRRKRTDSRTDAHTLAAASATNLLALSLPLVMMQIYDRILPNRSIETLTALMLGLLGAILIEFLLRASHGRVVSRAGARAEVGRARMLHHGVLYARLTDVEKTSFGGYMDRLKAIEDFNSVRHGDSMSAVVDVPFAMAFVVLILFIAPPIALLVCAIIIVTTLAVRRISVERIDMAIVRAETEGRRTAFLVQLFGAIEMIKSLGATAFMERRYERLMASNAALSSGLAANVAVAQGVTAAAVFVTPILVAAAGAALVIKDQLTVGGMAAAILLSGRAVQQVMRFNEIDEGGRDGGAPESVHQAWDAPPTPPAPRGTKIERVDELRAEGVAFTPAGVSKPVLRDVSLTVRRGEAVYVRGSVGAGKSALMNILAAHLDPDAGRVTLNGLPLREIDSASLRRHVAFLPQQHTLMEGTLFENMTRFRPDKLGDEALALADDLGLARFLDGHHSGLSTPVRRGVALGLPSAIVDRVSLIAALVGSPSLIIFDESNLALDADGDQRLRDLLAERRPNAAIVMVSQRPSYLSLCDRGFYLSDGVLEPENSAAYWFRSNRRSEPPAQKIRAG